MLAGWNVVRSAKYNMISYIEATKATIVTGDLSAKQNEYFLNKKVFCIGDIKGVACVAFVAFSEFN